MRLFRTLQLGLVAFCFIWFWGGGTLLSWLYVPFVERFAKNRIVARKHVQGMIRGSFRVFCTIVRGLRLVDIDPRRGEAQVPQGPYVLIANHPTLIDVIALIACYDRLCCVVKGSVINGFMVGRMLRAAGYIDGGGAESPRGAGEVMKEAARRIEDGFGVMIFPEGTRSPPGDMHPFQRSSFEIASRTSVPLVPIHIFCNPPALMRGVPWYRFPNAFVEYRLTALPSRRIGLGRTEVRSAMKEVRSALLDYQPQRAT